MKVYIIIMGETESTFSCYGEGGLEIIISMNTNMLGCTGNSFSTLHEIKNATTD